MSGQLGDERAGGGPVRTFALILLVLIVVAAYFVSRREDPSDQE